MSGLCNCELRDRLWNPFTRRCERCSRYMTQADLTAAMSRNAVRNARRGLIQLKLDREAAVVRAAYQWAKLDQRCDDGAANIASITRAIIDLKPDVPEELILSRGRASDDLTKACSEEGKAEEALRDAARALLLHDDFDLTEESSDG